jgi:hypothetical protein
MAKSLSFCFAFIMGTLFRGELFYKCGKSSSLERIAFKWGKKTNKITKKTRKKATTM